jgi:hypothetical protein
MQQAEQDIGLTHALDQRRLGDDAAGIAVDVDVGNGAQARQGPLGNRLGDENP